MNKVHIQTLGCARNDVDSEELAGRLAAGDSCWWMTRRRRRPW